jgi:hypothetical protein
MDDVASSICRALAQGDWARAERADGASVPAVGGMERLAVGAARLAQARRHAHAQGEAVHVETHVKSAWSQRLKLKIP